MTSQRRDYLNIRETMRKFQVRMSDLLTIPSPDKTREHNEEKPRQPTREMEREFQRISQTKNKMLVSASLQTRQSQSPIMWTLQTIMRAIWKVVLQVWKMDLHGALCWDWMRNLRTFYFIEILLEKKRKLANQGQNGVRYTGM